MTSALHEADRLDAWTSREDRVFQALPYGTLVLSTGLAALIGPPSPGPRLLALFAIATGTLGWVAVGHRCRRGWQGSPLRAVVFFLGFLCCAGALVVLSPWYGFFAWCGYLYAFDALPGRWAIPGVAGAALVSATAIAGGPPTDGPSWAFWAVIALASMIIASAVGWFAKVREQQNILRKRAIQELAETNRKLEESMRENQGLHTQLLIQAREAGVLDERQRMAREIHDTIAQGLAGVITQLEAAGQARDRRVDWQRHVDNATRLARESLTEARRSVRAIGPEPLATAQLPDALADLVERWSGLQGVRAEITTTGTIRRMHPEIEVALLRTAQEALTNVAKHAAASRVGLTLSYMEDVVTLDVRDDGVGFAIPPEPATAARTAPATPAGTAGTAGPDGDGGPPGTRPVPSGRAVSGWPRCGSG
ncbi:sensor histidine kinase [Micromonospora zhanjiangensis]